MNSTIKVAVIGGTGKAGKYLVKQLINQNIAIRFLHRKPETLKIDNPLIEIIKGDARDYSAIHSLLQDCNTVISCLSQPVGEPTIFSDATHNILTAMQAQGLTRYITTAGLNVDTPSDKKGSQTQFGTQWMYDNYPETTADRQLEYELIVASNIAWTMVRLPLIIQTDEVSEIAVSLTDCPGSDISATSLALFMIRALRNDEFIKQAPFIANK